MKNGALWGRLCHVALVRTDVSEELIAYFIRVTRIGELGTTLAVTSNRRTLRRNTAWCYIPPKRRFSQEPNGITSQKTPFFIVFSNFHGFIVEEWHAAILEIVAYPLVLSA
jgi:hypothetical protein